MNIMLNGIEAMKETGGVLTVKSQPGQADQVMISVSDTGVGLPTENADQIFSAFFTTKPQAQEWVWRSAAPSSSHMVAACGLPRILRAGRTLFKITHYRRDM